MIISFAQSFVIFIAVFISAYLLSLAVDFKSTGKPVKLSPFMSGILFPFCRLGEYNVASVCLQVVNYLQFTVFVLLNLFYKYQILVLNEYIQSAIILLFLVSTLIATAISKRFAANKYKNKEINND